MQYSFFKDLDGCQNLVSNDVKTPSLLSKILYKPNMSINSIFPLFMEATNNSRLNNIDFMKATKLKSEFEQKGLSLRNYVGSLLTNMSSLGYNNQSIAEVFALDAKIKLYNSTIGEIDLPEDVSHINNPFFDDGKAAYYSKDKKSICFDMDLIKDKEGYRCLRVR